MRSLLVPPFDNPAGRLFFTSLIASGFMLDDEADQIYETLLPEIPSRVPSEILADVTARLEKLRNDASGGNK